MELILLIVADLALGGIAWRLAKKNEENTKSMATAVTEMKNAVAEISKLNELMYNKVNELDLRVTKLEREAA